MLSKNLKQRVWIYLCTKFYFAGLLNYIITTESHVIHSGSACLECLTKKYSDIDTVFFILPLYNAMDLKLSTQYVIEELTLNFDLRGI